MTCATAIENLNHFAITRKGGRLFDRLLRVEAWLDARASRRALYRLDSRGLADIGLTEADLYGADPTTSWRSLLQG